MKKKVPPFRPSGIPSEDLPIRREREHLQPADAIWNYGPRGGESSRAVEAIRAQHGGWTRMSHFGPGRDHIFAMLRRGLGLDGEAFGSSFSQGSQGGRRQKLHTTLMFTNASVSLARRLLSEGMGPAAVAEIRKAYPTNWLEILTGYGDAREALIMRVYQRLDSGIRDL